MKYWVMKISNGELQLNLERGDITEHGTLDSAKAKFHRVCATMWNESSVLTAKVVIIDQQFNVVESEFIQHIAQPTEE